MVTRDPSYNPGRVQPIKNESDEEEEDDDDDDYDRDSGNERYSSSRSRTNFTNALLRVGTKSTKDSSLDKPVRKGPGLLLEAAGRSLAQRAGGSNQSYKSGTGGSSILSGGATIGGLSFGLASSKISFGLYRGDLPVDHGSYTKNKSENTSPSNNDGLGADKEENESRLGKASDNTRQKVFSNWGGEFFKKNLDYRANTNKILEKMNLTGKSNGDSTGNSSSASGSTASGSSWMKSASTGGSKRPLEQDSNNSPSKKLKSSFLNSYS